MGRGGGGDVSRETEWRSNLAPVFQSNGSVHCYK
jgi:hypothetical protein